MTKIAPSEPAPAPPKGYRPHMPMKVKLEAALRALGLTLETVDFDHTPPLQMRVWRPDKGDTEPAANDPAFIMPMLRDEHRKKTSGGTTKAKSQGDVYEITKTKHLAPKQEDFRRALLSKEPGTERKPKGKWASRPFGRKKAK